MAPTTNARILFKDIPTGYPEPGKTTVTDTSEKIDLDTVPLNGGVLLKTLVVSIDPYMRGRMRDVKVWSYVPAFPLGEPITSVAVSTVLRSENEKFKAGEHVYGMIPVAEYNVISNSSASGFIALPKDTGLPNSAFLGAAGIAGQTAYVGWREYADAKKGDTVFVSGGAGAVGSFVIQLAKREGLKVIASAGSEEKVAFLKELGADVAFNYKTDSTAEILEKEGSIDVYWDNVGGETLDHALTNATIGARFIICGLISGYNGDAQPMKNMHMVLAKRVHMHGFMVNDLMPKYQKDFYSTVVKWIADGEIKYNEYKYDGIDATNVALMEIQKGANLGKSYVKVANA